MNKQQDELLLQFQDFSNKNSNKYSQKQQQLLLDDIFDQQGSNQKQKYETNHKIILKNKNNLIQPFIPILHFLVDFDLQSEEDIQDLKPKSDSKSTQHTNSIIQSPTRYRSLVQKLQQSLLTIKKIENKLKHKKTQFKQEAQQKKSNQYTVKTKSSMYNSCIVTPNYQQTNSCLQNRIMLNSTINSKKTIFSNLTTRIITEQNEKKQMMNESRKKYMTTRTKQQFLQSIKIWQQQKQKKYQYLVQKQLKQQMNGVTFAPNINHKSKLLMKKKGKILPIYERDIAKNKGCCHKLHILTQNK